MTDWKKITPPSAEQQAFLDDALVTIKSPIGWAQRKGHEYPELLPDIQALWAKYQRDAFRDISTKQLPSDHLGASSINRQLNKPLLELLLSDRGWLGDYYGNSDWADFKDEEKMNKWELQGIFKVMCYVLYHQQDKEMKLRELDFHSYEKKSFGIEVTDPLLRIFLRPKDVMPCELRKKHVDPEIHRAKSYHKNDEITVQRVMDTTFSKEEMEQLVRHFQGLLNVEEKQVEIQDVEDPIPEEKVEEVVQPPVVKSKQPGPEIVDIEFEGVEYWEDEDTDEIYTKLQDGTFELVGKWNDNANEIIWVDKTFRRRHSLARNK